MTSDAAPGRRWPERAGVGGDSGRAGPHFRTRGKSEGRQISSLRTKTLTAAAEILTARGPEGMSLKAIADHAGIGIASIYHYFKGKDELLLNLAILGFEDLRRDIARFQARPEFNSPMRAATRAFLSFAQTRPEFLSLMFSERLNAANPMLRDAEQATFRAYQAAVQADSRLPPQHRANAALALWTLGRGIASLTSSQPDRTIPTETFERLMAGASYLINHPD